jgi:hypothetical protein
MFDLPSHKITHGNHGEHISNASNNNKTLEKNWPKVFEHCLHLD